MAAFVQPSIPPSALSPTLVYVFFFTMSLLFLIPPLPLSFLFYPLCGTSLYGSCMSSTFYKTQTERQFIIVNNKSTNTLSKKMDGNTEEEEGGVKQRTMTGGETH